MQQLRTQGEVFAWDGQEGDICADMGGQERGEPGCGNGTGRGIEVYIALAQRMGIGPQDSLPVTRVKGR